LCSKSLFRRPDSSKYSFLKHLAELENRLLLADSGDVITKFQQQTPGVYPA